MANMVLTLGGGKTTQQSLEVYRDVSMDAATVATGQRKAVDRLVNVKAVQNSLHQIFMWIPGERILNPEFGSSIRKYLYEGITSQNIEAIMAEIRHCVTEWEPRVVIDKVVNVQSTDDTENNTVRLDIYYHIKGLTDDQFVYSYNYYRGQP